MKITLRIACALLFIGLLVVRPTPSYAWHGHTYVGVHLGWPGPYYYGYGYPYYPDYYPYSEPYYYPPAEVVSSDYQPVVINGTTYYLNNGVYYIYTRYGYQAVPTPSGTAQAATAEQSSTTTTVTATDDNTITINIPNNKGSYTPVVLKRSGNGYVGPQGEFYSEFPKVSQLKEMYGK